MLPVLLFFVRMYSKTVAFISTLIGVLTPHSNSQELRYIPAFYFTNTFALGQSFYSLQGSPADKPAFSVPEASIKHSRPQESSTRTTFRRVDSASQAYSAFSFDTNLSADFVIASVDGRVFTGHEHQIAKSSTTIVCYVKKLTGSRTFPHDIQMVQLEKSLRDAKFSGRKLPAHKFSETYGDAYVSEVYEGAVLFASATLSFSSAEERRRFEGAVNAEGFGASLDASTRSSLDRWSSTKIADVEFKSFGGPPFSFNSGDIAGLLASVEAFTSGITKANSAVVGYNLKNYRSFSGVETLLDGELRIIPNREVDAELKRLLAFSGVRHTLKNSVSQIPQSFTLGSAVVSSTDALKELHNYGEAIAHRAQYIGKYGQMPDATVEATDPQLSLASATGAESLLRKYADLRIERSGTLDVPFSFYATPQRPASILKSDGQVDSGNQEWTRMTLSQSIDGTTLVSRMSVIEGENRAVPILSGNFGGIGVREVYPGKKREKVGDTTYAVVNPAFKAADDTILSLTGRNAIPYQVQPGEEVVFQLAPGAGNWVYDTAEKRSGTPRVQLVPHPHRPTGLWKLLNATRDAHRLEHYGLKEVRATLDSEDRNDHHFIGCDGIVVVQFVSTTRGESLLNEYLSSF